MGKKIYIHMNAKDLVDAGPSVDRLRHYGYEVLFFAEQWGLPFEKDCWVVDSRCPSWRGWRSIMSDIDWRHYGERLLDKTEVVVYNDVEEEAECFV